MVSVEGLSKRFDNQEHFAVENISFSLEKGDIAALIGTSGCGKTTTLKMINRLIEPSQGKISVSQKPSHSLKDYEWRRLFGYVIQKSGLLPHLTIYENISLLSQILKKDSEFIKQRVQTLMKLVNLDFETYHNRYPVELSGGQQQRVGIARALMEDPEVLLMDEPFGALDPITRNNIHQELLDINAKLKKTILIVTHDLQEAFKLCNKIILMDQGQIIQQGSPKELRDNPENKFVKDFIGGQL